MSFAHMIISSLHKVFHYLLPSSCVFCSMPGSDICIACFQDLPILSQHCPYCAEFLPFNTRWACGECLISPPPFAQTFALFPYQPPIIQLIIQLKFQQKLNHANILAALLFKRIRTTWYLDKPLPDLLIPMPLHEKRLRERGFNQALEIAKPLAHALSMPIDWDGFLRIRATAAQSGLSAKERKKNIASAFACTKDYQGKTIALIDDIITTGHTIRAASASLRQAGAKQIDIWCCARNQLL